MEDVVSISNVVSRFAAKHNLETTFDQEYEVIRRSKGIREAAKQALQIVIGPTKVTSVTDGYLLECKGKTETSDNNDNSFLDAARRLAAKFKSKPNR